MLQNTPSGVLPNTPSQNVFPSTALGAQQNTQRCATKHTKVCYKTHQGVLQNTQRCAAKHTFQENTPFGVLKFGQAKNTPFGVFSSTPYGVFSTPKVCFSAHLKVC